MQITHKGPVGTTLEVLTNKELSSVQKNIMLYMLFESSFSGEVKQRSIYTDLNFSNKTARINLEELSEKGYVKRGTRAGSWELA